MSSCTLYGMRPVDGRGRASNRAGAFTFYRRHASPVPVRRGAYDEFFNLKPQLYNIVYSVG